MGGIPICIIMCGLLGGKPGKPWGGGGGIPGIHGALAGGGGLAAGAVRKPMRVTLGFVLLEGGAPVGVG